MINSVEPFLYHRRRDDEFVGVANMKMRKIYYLFDEKVSEWLAANAAYSKSVTKVAISANLARLRHLELEKDALESIFWLACIEKFPKLLVGRYMAVRRGWELVWTERYDQVSATIAEDND
ncbi:MAG TPA: hypothetical protein PKD95_04655 [Candidatus Paceibacterota bacterium]|nr:hypothetical protein [Candidatus Paceibacterota bacterium]